MRKLATALKALIEPSWRRVRVRLRQSSPVLLLGIAIFVLGFGLTLLRPSPSGDTSDPSLIRSFNHILETVGARVVPDVLLDPDTQLRFNVLLLAMAQEALPPDGRDLLDAAILGTRGYFSKVFSGPSFVTLILALVGYAVLARRVDKRLERGFAGNFARRGRAKALKESDESVPADDKGEP